MTRERMAEILEEIALLMECKDENPFKIRAYRQGAETVRQAEADPVLLARENRLTEISGLGPALREKLTELATTGQLAFHQELRAEFPPGLFELFDLPGLGPKKIRLLHLSLGIGSLAELRQACEENRIASLPGFAAKSQQKLLEAIRRHSESAGRFLLAAATSRVRELEEWLRSHPQVSQLSPAGSYRRAKETVADLDFLVASPSPAEVCRDFAAHPDVEEILACGETKTSVRLTGGLQCDLRAVSNEAFPFALQYFTGSKEHNVALRSLALRQGYRLNEYGLHPLPDHTPPPASPPAIHQEADLYHALGLAYIEPELRENHGEIEAATHHQLPRLIRLGQLKGTFHNHTTASDGDATLAQMAAEAAELGLQYLGISDHSRSSHIANGLTAERLLGQIEEIHSLNASSTLGIHLFSGSEVDILKDGSLDFPDEILARLDYCVASVHQHFQLPAAEMTRRICRAMENPHVTMLGHPTGRLLLRRPEYEIDLARIIDCAAETRTVIELNCSPKRLDLDWRWWKRARDKGVLCSINPDAHSTAGLHHLALGTRLARKGWLEAAHILNSRSLAEIQSFLTTPKNRRT